MRLLGGLHRPSLYRHISLLINKTNRSEAPVHSHLFASSMITSSFYTIYLISHMKALIGHNGMYYTKTSVYITFKVVFSGPGSVQALRKDEGASRCHLR